MSAPVRPAASTTLRLVTVLVAIVAATVLSPQSATAADCNVQNPDGSINYGCTMPGDPGGNGNGNGGSDGGGIPGIGSGSGSGGAGTPSCDLIAPATFCVGSDACWYLPSVVPYAPPKGDPPDGDRGNWKVRSCRFLDSGVETKAVWMGGKNTPPPPPSLPEQAQTAFGQLTPAVGTLASNPRTTSLVTLPTWFWAEGLPGELTGSSAFGLVAIARPQSLQVTPGDGSATLDCPWSTAPSDVCSHSYERSSAARGTTEVDGHRAYAVTAQPVWSVEFELNGTPINIDGAPTELRGPTMTTGVRVAEVQALVNRIG